MVKFTYYCIKHIPYNIILINIKYARKLKSAYLCNVSIILGGPHE